MRTITEYKQILALHKQGLNQSEIARKTGLPRRTVGDTINKFESNKDIDNYANHRASKNAQTIERLTNPKSETDRELCRQYAYFLGMFLGDGSIVRMGRSDRLRITCDAKYPNIIKKIEKALAVLMPTNKVGLVYRHYNGHLSCIDVSCYSKDWKMFFPFFRFGKKHTYKVYLEVWQKSIVKTYAKDFWLGLYQADGCRYISGHSKIRDYIAYQFVQKSTDIMNLFLLCCDHIGITYGVRDRRGIARNGTPTTCRVATMYGRDNVALIDTFAGPKT